MTKVEMFSDGHFFCDKNRFQTIFDNNRKECIHQINGHIYIYVSETMLMCFCKYEHLALWPQLQFLLG